nr:hypothetical protein [Salinimonas marina]
MNTREFQKQCRAMLYHKLPVICRIQLNRQPLIKMKIKINGSLYCRWANEKMILGRTIAPSGPTLDCTILLYKIPLKTISSKIGPITHVALMVKKAATAEEDKLSARISVNSGFGILKKSKKAAFNHRINNTDEQYLQ